MRVAVLAIVSERSYGSIFSARVEEPDHERQGEVIRVKALAKDMVGFPAAGEVWRVDGHIVAAEWGFQLEAKRAIREIPDGRLVVSFLAHNVPCVGVARAERLWRRWGIRLADVLSDEQRVADIAEVIAPDRPNLGPALAAACCRTWVEMTSSTRTMLWLASQGIADNRLAGRLIAILGETAVERLQSNPYVLVALLPWGKVDEVGIRLLREAGIEAPRRDPRRLIGVVDAAVKRAIGKGDTELDDQTLRESVAQLLAVGVSSTSVSKAIELGEEAGALVRGPQSWRAPGCAALEDDLATRLRSFGSQNLPSPVHLPPPELLKSALAEMRVSGHAMHPEQRSAVLRLLQAPLACLQGGAGVGKTTVLQALCDLWRAAGGQVVLCTIAGKAALRLSKATHRPAMTLARLLAQLREREQIDSKLAAGKLGDYEREAHELRLTDLLELTPATLVVIDEASMVDLSTAHELVRRLPPSARLLLVGDEAQLPPVGFGLVYHRLVDDSQLTTRLTQVHRQSADSGIPGAAAAIRQGATPVLPDYRGRADGISVLAVDKGELQNAVVRVWDELGGRLAGTLICTATKAGVAGVNELNQLLQRRHAERTGFSTVRGFFSHWYCPGDPVVWLRNDYRLGLYNGLLGQVLSVDPDSGGVVVQFEGCEQPHDVGAEQLVDLALGYAITCHRAQGSQAPAIIVPLYPTRVLDPSWLYTAVTRAERQVVLVGNPEVMEAALAQPWAARRRRVGFRW